MPPPERDPNASTLRDDIARELFPQMIRLAHMAALAGVRARNLSECAGMAFEAADAFIAERAKGRS